MIGNKPHQHTWLLGLFVFVISACSQQSKIAALAPEPDVLKTTIVESKTSYISLPVTLSFAEIQRLANVNLKGILYKDDSFDNDNLKIEITKLSDFKVSESNGKIQTTIPIRVTGTYRYGASAFGYSLYDTKEFKLGAVITLSSAVSLYNWQLQTKTNLSNIDWTESPAIMVAGKEIPLTFLLKQGISIFKSDIEKLIDTSIKEATNIKPQVLDGIAMFSKPQLIDVKTDTWFNIIPVEVYASNAKVYPTTIEVQLGLKCNMETHIGNKPTAVFNKDNIILKAVASMPDKFLVNLAAITSYDAAAKMIEANFVGKEFSAGKRKITVNKIELWQKDGKLIVATDVTGSIAGRIYFSGVPKYNSELKEIYIDEMNFVLDTKNRLQRSAGWLLKSYIVNQIQENCKYNVAKDIDMAKKNMAPYLTNYSPTKGVIVNGELKKLDFSSIQLTNKSIVLFIEAAGAMNIKLDGL